MLRWSFFIFSMVCSTFLSAQVNILAISGSTRKDSLNQKLVNEAAEMAKQMGAKVTIVYLKDYPMPFYDGDLESESGLPPKAKDLRHLLIESQAILLASPEYNHSVSGILKNAIDWVSRGGKEAFRGKKIALMSVSPGKKGGVKGLLHLKDIIDDVGGSVISQQVVVPNGLEAFDEKGKLKNAQLKMELKQLVFKAVN